MNEKETVSFFKELGEYIKPYKAQFTVSVILSFIAVLCGLASYGVIGILCGLIFDNDTQTSTLFLIIGFAALCKILNAVLLNLSTGISHKAAYRTLKDIRIALSEKMMRLPLGFFEKTGSGRLKTIIVDRVEEIEKTLAHFLPEMTANLCVPIGFTVWMFFIDYRLALCVLIWIILGLSIGMGMMKNYNEKYAGQVAAGKNMNQAVVEYVGGIEVIKTFNQTQGSYEKYSKAIEHHANYSVEWMKSNQLFASLSYSVAPVSIFGVLILGLIFYGNGSLDIANFFLFMIISLGIFGPIAKASSYVDQLAQMGSIAKEIKEILDYPELKRKNQDDALLNGYEIELNNISFSYDNDDKLAIKNVSAIIPQKSMFALVGGSGGGKSTIAKLLAGYFDVSDGEIKIGGVNLTDISVEQLNKMIAYVDQDTYLFEMSIMENIRIANPNASDDEVVQVCKKVGCHDFISKLPNGYATQAGVAGNRLSGGEKQRIAIARAMMKDAPIMILDEATASSDPENEVAIQEALTVSAQNKTLIVVAHKLQTIKNAGQIAFVKDGEITHIGTHENLLMTCPSYKKLWDITTKEGDEPLC